jgi:hypothetical protein
LKPGVVGPRIEKTKMLAAGNPVGPIPPLENDGNDARRQSIGWREYVKSIAVEAGQSLAAGKPNQTFGIDQNAADGSVESILGGEYRAGQLLGEGSTNRQARCDTTSEDIPEWYGGVERLHVRDATTREIRPLAWRCTS